MKRKYILKEAVVLLIAVGMFLSTVTVTADTEDDIRIRNRQTSFADSFAEVSHTYIESDPTAYLHNTGPVIFDQQPIPDETGGNGPFSDAGQGSPPYRCYENFWGLTEDICDIHWWGLWGFGTGTPTVGDTFQISFCADNGGIPDYTNHLHDFTGSLGAEITYVGTGNFYWGYELFYMEMDLLPCVSMASGWVSIYKTTVNAQKFAWLDALTGDGKAYQLNAPVPLLDYDLAFELTAGEEPCNPSIDVEKEVKDKNGTWQDADTRNEAADVLICQNITYRITITNTGDCPLIDIRVLDTMHDSIKYISSDPEGESWYEEPYYYIEWFFPGPLEVNDTIVIIITAHVEGPECSIDPNHVMVDATCVHGKPVSDEDWCYVHCGEEARALDRPFLRFLQSYPNLFRIMEKLLQRLGL